MRRAMSLLTALFLVLTLFPSVAATTAYAAGADVKAAEKHKVWLISKPLFKYKYYTDLKDKTKKYLDIYQWDYDLNDDGIIDSPGVLDPTPIKCNREGDYFIAPGYISLLTKYNNTTSVDNVPGWEGAEFLYKGDSNTPFNANRITASNAAFTHWAGNEDGSSTCYIAEDFKDVDQFYKYAAKPDGSFVDDPYPSSSFTQPLKKFESGATLYSIRPRVRVSDAEWCLDKGEQYYSNMTMFLFEAKRDDLPPPVWDASQGTVVFDCNLPGKPATVEYLKDVGATVTVPSVKTTTINKVTFEFKGWYDKPSGGTKIGSTVTVPSGYQVYYAQWELKVDPGGGGGTPSKGDMYLVYFDQNIAGGGVTTAYVTAGTFSFDVEYEWTDPETGDSETRTDTVTVSIPFNFPGDPHRTGYTFEGWSESATGGGTINQGSWAPTQAVTTLYGVWTADRTGEVES